MVKHIVMWKLKEMANGENKKTNALKMKKILEALQGVVPGVFKMEVGINYNPAGFDVALYSEFEDADALEGYKVHPEHKKVQEFVHQVITDRVVADYMV